MSYLGVGLYSCLQVEVECFSVLLWVQTVGPCLSSCRFLKVAPLAQQTEKDKTSEEKDRFI